MSGFVRLAEGILFWQVQETGSRVSEGIFTEAVFLGISVLVGMGLFLLYDIFRIFRRIVPHGAIWIGVEDFCYWLLCTAAVFLMLYQENDGMIRGFAIGGVIFGMILYFFPPQQICCKDQCVYFEENTWHCGKDNRFCDKTFSKDWQENHKFFM
ncbi:MAG: spore cortex biosynthesis protein YabQ [Roseburia inulinivorans]